jgi:hypothetical protein
VRIEHLAAGGDYEAAVAEARSGAPATPRVEALSVPIAFGAEAAQAVADRALAEAHAARESARFVLPPSRLELEPGDLVEVGGATRHRIDRVTDRWAREISARRTDVSRRARPPAAARAAPPPPVRAATAGLLAAVLIDLPRVGGLSEGSPHAMAFGETSSGPVGAGIGGHCCRWMLSSTISMDGGGGGAPRRRAIRASLFLADFDVSCCSDSASHGFLLHWDLTVVLGLA